MTELKPCPFCGCEDIRYKVHQDHLGNWHGSIYCREHYNKTNDDDRCWSMFYARSPNSREEVIEKLIKKWNKRPNPWHTGTPTEENCFYVLQCKGRIHHEPYFGVVVNGKFSAINDDGDLMPLPPDLVAWQKIKPHKEKS